MSSASPQTLDLDAEIHGEVLEFCATNELTPYVLLASRLARETFRSIQRFEIELQADPDVEQQRILIEVFVDNATPDDVLRMKKDYTHRWVASAPADVRERIRLLYNLC